MNVKKKCKNKIIEVQDRQIVKEKKTQWAEHKKYTDHRTERTGWTRWSVNRSYMKIHARCWTNL